MMAYKFASRSGLFERAIRLFRILVRIDMLAGIVMVAALLAYLTLYSL